MGALAKSLAAATPYSARKAGLWPELMDQLEGCLYPAAIDAFEAHIVSLGLQIPNNWHEHLANAVEKKRQEISDENITDILRERFDF